MNDGQGTKPQEHSGTQDLPAGVREDLSAAQPATEQQLERAEQKIEERIEERLSAFERTMLRLTGAAIFISVVTGLIFAGQLYEMVEGGKQTDKLLSAAGTQADAASDMADAAGNQVDAADNFSDTAEEINRKIATAVIQLQAAANNAKTGLDTTRDAMHLE